MNTKYAKGQFIAISYSERLADGSYKTHINRIFKIMKAEQVAADGVEMLVDSIHKATGAPLREGVNCPWDVTVKAQDGSIHKFNSIHNRPHQLHVNGKWEVIKSL